MRRSAALALLIVLSSCTPASVTAPPSATAETPARGGRITVGIFRDISNFDPLLATNAGQVDYHGLVTGQIYEPLVAADKVTGEVLPSLATWTTTAVGRTYEFEIDAAAVWSDGRPIVAEDFITAMRAVARSKKAAGRVGLLRIEGFVEYRQGAAPTISGLIANGKRLTVRLNTVFCPILSLFVQTPPLPTHVFARYLSDVDTTRNADDAAEHLAPMVTSGPFAFREWRRGDEIALRANGRYWRGAPLVDELVFRVIPSVPEEPAGLLRSGQLQLIHLPKELPETIRDMERDPSLRIIRHPFPNYTYIGWNTLSGTVPGFRDERVRQALAYGLDAQRAVREILFGEGTVTRQPIARTSWAYTQGSNEYAYDPRKAEELIRAAGYTRGADGLYEKDGRPLAFVLAADRAQPVRAALVQFAVDQYRAIGVGVTPALEEFIALTERLSSGDPSVEAHVAGRASVLDPDPAGVWYSRSTAGAPLAVPANSVGYASPELDRAIDEGRFGPDCSIAARKRAYDTFNRILSEDQPYNVLFTPNQFVVMSARVRGVAPGAYVPLPDSHLWWLATQK